MLDKKLWLKGLCDEILTFVFFFLIGGLSFYVLFALSGIGGNNGMFFLKPLNDRTDGKFKNTADEDSEPDEFSTTIFGEGVKAAMLLLVRLYLKPSNDELPPLVTLVGVHKACDYIIFLSMVLLFTVKSIVIYCFVSVQL